MSDLPKDVPDAQISASRGLADWLRVNRTSLAFTSYQTGQLFLVGVLPGGGISVNQQSYARAMGVAFAGGRLYLGTMFQVWRLENSIGMGSSVGPYDACFVPRNAQTTGDIDIHEVGVDRDGRVIFVNSKYSCLATLDLTHSFRPIWHPPFISRLAAEDRCHLNGMAMADGRAAYVTAASRSDIVSGWRERRRDGGIVMEVASGRIVADMLSMPHSPRLSDGQLYVLDSGRGQIARIDPGNGRRDTIAFLPGFLRGLAIVNGHAIVTLSKPRDGSFKGLELDATLAECDGTAWCGVAIVQLDSGDIIEWLRLDGDVTELFDVTALPGIACPMSLGINTLEIQSSISFSPMDAKA